MINLLGINICSNPVKQTITCTQMTLQNFIPQNETFNG